MNQGLDARYSYDFERSFNYLWEKIIDPTIRLVECEVSTEFKEACGLEFAYSDKEEYKQKVMSFYRERREWLKDIYLPHERHPILDEHKLGAIWCRTMLAYKPFYFNFKRAESYVQLKFGNSSEDVGEGELIAENNSDWFTKNIYCNYRVAFLVGAGIVYLYLLYDCKEKDDNLPEYLREAYEYFREEQGMKCPTTTPTHNDFITSCIIALQKNDMLERDFDYLAYAIIFFQLEHYNKMCYYMQKQGLSIDLV